MKRGIHDPELRRSLAHLAHAIRPFVDCERGPTRAALELAANATQLLVHETDLDACELLDDMIRHRVRHGWLSCSDVRSAARVGADAWLHVAGREGSAAA